MFDAGPSPHTRCPFCGNDRVVNVTQFQAGEGIRRAYCAGTLGCQAWWNPTLPDPVALKGDDRLEGIAAS